MKGHSPVVALALTAVLLAGGCASGKGNPQPATRPSAGPTSGVVRVVTTDGSIVELTDGSVFAIVSGDASRWVGQHVRAVSGGGVMITASGERGESQYVGSVHVPRTYSNSGEHNQESASPGGELVLLDDGSVWWIPPSERSRTSRWAEGASVNVEDGPGRSYRLTNGASASTVLARYVGEK